MDSETWRWAIGGGLAAVSAGVVWLIRAAYQIGGTLQRIDDRLTSHGELHAKHADDLEAHDDRLRQVELNWARMSGQWKATK